MVSSLLFLRLKANPHADGTLKTTYRQFRYIPCRRAAIHCPASSTLSTDMWVAPT